MWPYNMWSRAPRPPPPLDFLAYGLGDKGLKAQGVYAAFQLGA